MKTGYRTIQIHTDCKPYEFVSVIEEGQQIDKFAQVMQLVQNLSDKEPFKPELLFNKEMPEEVKLYLRNIFAQRIKGLSSSLDVSKLSDEDIFELSPKAGDTLESYRTRAQNYLSNFEGAE